MSTYLYPDELRSIARLITGISRSLKGPGLALSIGEAEVFDCNGETVGKIVYAEGGYAFQVKE